MSLLSFFKQDEKVIETRRSVKSIICWNCNGLTSRIQDRGAIDFGNFIISHQPVRSKSVNLCQFTCLLTLSSSPVCLSMLVLSGRDLSRGSQIAGLGSVRINEGGRKETQEGSHQVPTSLHFHAAAMFACVYHFM